MTDDAPTNSRAAWTPDWKRATCLGCSLRVVKTRDSWVEIAGTRDGRYIIAWGSDPLFALASDPDRVLDEPLYLLGVAHQTCLHTARASIEAGTANLADHLPVLEVEQGATVQMPKSKLHLHLPSHRDECPFCGATSDLTDEHVWPEWFSRDLRSQGLKPVGVNVRRNTIDITVPVCETCNNTWMSVLENDVAPLLRQMTQPPTDEDNLFVLTKTQQIRLASWATMKAYLIDALERPAVPRGFLHEFALRREPNESTLVWTAHYAPDTAARATKRSFDFQTPHGPTSNSPNAFMVTFTIFDVLFQVLGHFNGGPATMNGGRPQFDGALVPVWPPCAAGFPWPPPFAFGNASWDALTTSVTDGHEDERPN